ncbi:MAG TPA: hypothetical protein VNT77_10105 [Allosphingosinicella sp.]|nr:hypothetical protein [Allosphingosinicella sp.]
MAKMYKSGFKAALMAALLAAPQMAPAQLFLEDPDFRRGAIDPSDPMVGLPIPGATPAEYRAHLLWNLRAGLNVAALQCQFSPYLRAVDNYNGILAHHAKELADAYATMNAYFKRTQGAQGQKAFDDYTTITYNNFSTLHAQYGFCQTATAISKEALAQPKGELYTLAAGRMRELRNSLTPAYDRIGVYTPHNIRIAALPSLDPKCWDKKNRLVRRCQTQIFG